MSKAYPTWDEQSMIGKMGVMLWLAAFLIFGIAAVAIMALFVGAFLWALPGALWAERLWLAIAGACFGGLLVWASIKGA